MRFKKQTTLFVLGLVATTAMIYLGTVESNTALSQTSADMGPRYQAMNIEIARERYDLTKGKSEDQLTVTKRTVLIRIDTWTGLVEEWGEMVAIDSDTVITSGKWKTIKNYEISLPRR